MKHKAAFQLEKHGARVVYRLTWGEVRRILGRDHANTAADDQKLVRALRAAGARPLGKSYAKEDGWHAFAPKGTPAPALPKRSNPAEPPPTRRRARAMAASAKAHKEADKIGESMRAAYKPEAAPDTRAEDLRKVQAALGTMRVQANAAGDDAKAAKAGADVAYFEGMADGASISGQFVADMLRAAPRQGAAARARAALSSLAERVRSKGRPKGRKRAKPSR